MLDLSIEMGLLYLLRIFEAELSVRDRVKIDDSG
jgi:hypothetical protein